MQVMKSKGYLCSIFILTALFFDPAQATVRCLANVTPPQQAPGSSVPATVNSYVLYAKYGFLTTQGTALTSIGTTKTAIRDVAAQRFLQLVQATKFLPAVAPTFYVIMLAYVGGMETVVTPQGERVN